MEKQRLNISCDTITLDVFIDCAVNNNLRRLSKDATDEELTEIWNGINEEYATKSGNVKHNYIFDLAKKIALLENKIKIGALMIQFDNDEAKAMLQKIGYRGDVEALIKRDNKTLLSLQSELEKANQNDGTGKLTEADFLRWINIVSKFMGFRINRKVVTVTEFLEMERLMKVKTDK